MSKELGEFRQLVVSLFRSGQRYFKIHGSAYTLPLQWFVNERPLEELLKAESGDFGNKLVPLSAPSGIGSPLVAMWCKWDFSENEVADCKLEVLIYRAPKQVYGFRIDPPHAREKHKYWHTQFMHSFSNPAIPSPPSDATWISDSTPAFPIALEKPGVVMPSDAAVYAMLSLYGREIPKDIHVTIRSVALSTSLRYILGS